MLLAVASVLVQSCGKDNQVAYPESTISGRIVYQGQPVGLLHTSPDINSTNNQNNTLLLKQTGPGTYSGGDIKLYAKHDGSFTIKTFDGDYEMRSPAGRNPFQDFTPINFALKGDHKVDVEVTPYFWISNLQTTVVNNVLTATFKLDRIVPSANLAGIRVYFNTTNLVDVNATAVQRGPYTVASPGAGNVVVLNGNCTIKIDLNTFTNNEKIALAANTGSTFASIAVLTTGVQNGLYTDAIKIK